MQVSEKLLEIQGYQFSFALMVSISYAGLRQFGTFVGIGFFLSFFSLYCYPFAVGFSLKRLGSLFCSVLFRMLNKRGELFEGSLQDGTCKGTWPLSEQACEGALPSLHSQWTDPLLSFMVLFDVQRKSSCTGKHCKSLFLFRIFVCCMGFWRTPDAWLNCEVLFACVKYWKGEKNQIYGLEKMISFFASEC